MQSPTPSNGLILGFACFFACGLAAGQTVTSKNGNIYFLPAASGKPVRLTSSGLDREPNLSPDKKIVVFVRATPGRMVEGITEDEMEATELWTVHFDGTGPHLLLRGGSKEHMNVAYFKSPQFSPDARLVYFLSPAAATSDEVYAIDVRTGQVREVCPANSLLVVRRGEFAGNLVIEQHRYFIGGGSYDWTYVMTPDGKDVGPLGARNDPAFADRLKVALGDDEM